MDLGNAETSHLLQSLISIFFFFLNKFREKKFIISSFENGVCLAI